MLKVCRDINRIKMCMETGRTVILLNMENLYESLYDALNQVRLINCLVLPKTTNCCEFGIKTCVYTINDWWTDRKTDLDARFRYNFSIMCTWVGSVMWILALVHTASSVECMKISSKFLLSSSWGTCYIYPTIYVIAITVHDFFYKPLVYKQLNWI